MRYERVKVKRDLNTVHNHSVRPWEIPILEFVFEDGNVERTEEFQTVTGEYPEAQPEFERLTKAYGSDPQSGVPYVAAVYGNASVGVRNLRKAIEDAKASDEATATKAAPVPARAKRQ